MLEEMAHLFAATCVAATRDDYVRAVMEDNCLGKRTAATRRLSLQRLTELYGLDRRLLLFRVMRELWERHETSRPLLALLLALARDPLLRATATSVLRTPHGHEFARQPMTEALSEVAGERLNEGFSIRSCVTPPRPGPSPVTCEAGAERPDSACGQHRPPRRTRCCWGSDPGAVAAFCSRRRGAPSSTQRRRVLLEIAVAAKSLGLLDLKQSGSIIEVSFTAMLAGPRWGEGHGAHRQAG